jgi:hypothetical protein
VKKLLALMLATGLVAATGCSSGGTTGGGGGSPTKTVPGTPTKRVEPPATKEIALAGPADAVKLEIAKGKTEVDGTAKVTVDRKGGFTGDVKITAKVEPAEGLTVKEATVKADDKEATLTLKATKKGDYEVTLTAAGEGAKAGMAKVKITVTQKE